MLTGPLDSRFTRQGPPSRKTEAVQVESKPTESFEKARPSGSDHNLSNALKAVAALAMVATPEVANATEAATEVVADQPETGLLASLERTADNIGESLKGPTEYFKQTGKQIGEVAQGVKDTIDPHGYLNEKEAKLGDYDFRFRPIDADLKPKLKGGVPGLRLKGEFLETSIAKTTDLGEGWTRRQGFATKIEGELTTYDTPELGFNAGLFREYRGPLGDDYQARFQNSLGIRQNFIGDNTDLSAGLSFRQEIEGGHHSLLGHEYQIYAEGRQNITYNFDEGRTDMGYSFMVGPKKDFEIKAFGHKGTLTLTVGPEIKGSTNGDAFEPGFKTQARFRLAD